MSALAITWIIRAAVAATVLAILVGVKFKYDAHIVAPYKATIAQWEARVETEKKDAAQILNDAVEKNKQAKLSWDNELKAKNEEIKLGEVKLRNAADLAKRSVFVDFGATTNKGCGNPLAPIAGTPASASGAAGAAQPPASVDRQVGAPLSNALKDFLIAEALIADENFLYANACFNHVISVEKYYAK